MTTAPFDSLRFKEEAIQGWDMAAQDYEEYIVTPLPPHTRALVDFAQTREGQHVLDVATGTGMAALLAVSRVGVPGEVLGVDFSPKMLEVAEKKAQNMILRNISFRKMDAEKLSLGDASYEVVLCQLGLGYFTDPRQALLEMNRVLIPGGHLGLSTYGSQDKVPVFGLVWGAIVGCAPEATKGLLSPFVFGPQGVLQESLNQTGFKEIAIRRHTMTLGFKSPEAYWDIISSADGHIRTILGKVPPETSEAIKKEAVTAAQSYVSGLRVELPMELVIATAIK